MRHTFAPESENLSAIKPDVVAQIYSCGRKMYQAPGSLPAQEFAMEAGLPEADYYIFQEKEGGAEITYMKLERIEEDFNKGRMSPSYSKHISLSRQQIRNLQNDSACLEDIPFGREQIKLIKKFAMPVSEILLKYGLNSG